MHRDNHVALLLCLALLPSPLTSGFVAADPAESHHGGLRRGLVQTADGPVSAQSVRRTQRKPSPRYLTHRLPVTSPGFTVV